MKSIVYSVLMPVLVLLVSLQAQSQKKHRVTFDDLEHFNKTESLALSPDGKLLAYTVENIGEENLGLWLIDTLEGSRPRKIADGRFPVWASDGKHLAYYSRESGSLQLWEFDLSSAQKVQLTSLKDGIMPEYGTVFLGYSIYEAVRYAWSPDSAKIVFSSQVAVPSVTTSAIDASSKSNAESRGNPLILTSTTPREWTLAGVFSEGTTLQREWHDGKQEMRESESANASAKIDQLFVVDVAGKTTVQLTSGSLGYFSPDWSPDGNQIVCISSEGHPLLPYWVHTNIHLLGALDGRDTALTSDEMYNKHTPSWSPDGHWISYIATSNGDISKVSLLVLPRDGGKPIDTTSKLDRRVFDAHWLPDSRTMMVNYMDGVDWPIARLGVMSGEHAVISGSGAAGRGVTFTTSLSGAIAWTQNDSTNPAVIRVLRAGDSESHVLLDLNPEIKNWELPKQEVVRWKTKSGEEREGFLLKPVGYQPGKRYPLIIDAYPGMVNIFKAAPMEGNIA